jgi:nucleoside-diphosphate-sugar epimerase
MKKILLIGGNGYIGSFLNSKLKDDFEISSIDIDWFSIQPVSISKDFKNLTKNFIEQFDSVILLAGHSSVKMCDNNMLSSFNNNVQNFVELLSKLNSKQKFIYASSSSVYGNTNNNIVSEEYNTFTPNNYYDITKQIIDIYAQQSNVNFYGLRFGTVNGWSPNLRVDIMINAMVYSALSDGHIKLYIKDIMRPILGINDLSRAVKCIIDSKEDHPGIYNLASFNSTSEEIAISVSKTLNLPIKEYKRDEIEKISNFKLQTNAYNFAINSQKFERTFNFKFNDDITSIVNSLTSQFDNCSKTNRNEQKNYE